MEINIHCIGYPPAAIKLIESKLNLSDVQRYFPKATGLSYFSNGKKYLLTLKNEKYFELEENVLEYEAVCLAVHSKISMSEGQKKTFAEVLLSIKGKNSDYVEEQMKKSTKKIGTSPKQEKKKTRAVIMNWRHRKTPDSPFYKKNDPGQSKCLNLNSQEHYSLQEIIDLGTALFCDEFNKLYFEKCSIQLGRNDGQVIKTFQTTKGNDLWHYVAEINDGHKPSFSILTTPLSQSQKKVESAGANNQEEKDQSTSQLHLAGQSKQPEKNSEQDKSFITLAKKTSNHGIKDHLAAKENTIPNSQLEFQSTVIRSREEVNNSLPEMPSVTLTKRTIEDHPTPISPEFKKPRLDDISKMKVDFVTYVDSRDLLFSTKELGRGVYGVVTQGKWNGTPVAMKGIDMFGNNAEAIMREISIFRNITHPNIVNIMGVSKGFSQFYLIMELVDGHNLHEIIFKPRIKKMYGLTLDDKNAITIQMLMAFSFIHFHPKEVLHRDIKPANIMVNRHKQVKVCDFGLEKIHEICSKLHTTSGKNVPLGTLFYMAPELIIGKQQATIKSDVWSLGCTLVEFFSEKAVWTLEEDEYFEDFMKKKTNA